jgi:hypothetical protein
MAIDRFLIAAVTDRLIYDSETTFSAEDARVLLDAIPHKPAPRFGFSIFGTKPGGATQGYAAGIGNASIEDKDRPFGYATDTDSWTRAGQWKLRWRKFTPDQAIEIEQVMADPTDEGRSARIHFDAGGNPTGMDIQVPKQFALWRIVLVVPAWRPWKVPA